MRDTFVRTLFELAKEDRNIELVTGDLGFGVLKPFWEALPDQFINAGIAEQNMTTVAAGMALEGKNVFTYSIGNFPTLRCLEQIRNDCAYHNANDENRLCRRRICIRFPRYESSCYRRYCCYASAARCCGYVSRGPCGSRSRNESNCQASRYLLPETRARRREKDS